ncbi:MAG: site-specific integrase, partial [Pseudomonadota bacterium]
PQKPFRLWLKRAERGRAAIWRIKGPGLPKDGIATGCREHDLQGANSALVQYIAAHEAREASRRRGQDPADVFIADLLVAYWDAKKSAVRRPRALAQLLDRVNAWWGNRRVSEVTGANCRAYHEHRGGTRAGGEELAYLKAALRHAAAEGIIIAAPVVKVPPLNRPRERWLTRDEAAKLLRVCWRSHVMDGDVKVYTRRHLCRFILMGLYTGSRSAVILSARWGPQSMDIDAGVFRRDGGGEGARNKRRPPIRLPARLLAHARRWEKQPNNGHVIEWNGAAVKSIKTAWRKACTEAELGSDVVPHTLRHTCCTWLLANGAEKWEVAGYLGMTMAVIEATYGHHSVHHQRTVHQALSTKRAAKRAAKPALKVVASRN